MKCDIKRTKPLTRAGFRWHRIKLFLRHPLTFKKRIISIEYIFDEVNGNRRRYVNISQGGDDATRSV